ncbi:MAG TPA: ATP-binding cassette domain-containing protein [Chitinispirillaceae bacterium]|nr:ATP-binding cassette domain-containing protein [Chitinispirillaceae bacterium]
MKENSFSISVRSDNRAIVSTDFFPVYQNEITFLFGESGIGKSVLSKSVYGLLDPEGLEIVINNKPYGSHLNNHWTKQVRKNSFFVFQEPSSHLNPLMTIRDQLNEGSLGGLEDREILSYLWQSSGDESVRKIIDIFPKPYRPSGGEKQRILLAMAFKRINALIKDKNPDEMSFFVFDEPTGSLDNNYRDLFINLLFSKFRACPFTIQIITHDYSIISEIYRSHKDLLRFIHFKELSRISDTQVRVDDFSPREYLSWLNAPKNHKVDKSLHDTVLEVNPHFEIFGRSLSVFSDESLSEPAPLIIRKGEMVYLKAPSGVGKTTLAKIIMGLYKADKFRMSLCGLKVSQKSSPSVWQNKIWGKRAGMVFQHADEALNLESTVKETFKGLPLKIRINTETLQNKLMELFDPPVTKQFINKKVKYLSGGQKQRLNLLRTLILTPDLIILDEPLNGLDFNSVRKVLSLLDEKRALGSALLMISHNEEIFENFIDKKHVYHLNTTT